MSSNQAIIVFGVKLYDKILLTAGVIFAIGVGMFLLAGLFPFLKESIEE